MTTSCSTLTASSPQGRAWRSMRSHGALGSLYGAIEQTQFHLRALTVFSTVFISVDFFPCCCGINITCTHDEGESQDAMWVVLVAPTATAVVTW